MENNFNIYLSAILLAFAGAPHCLGMCGGLHFSAQHQHQHGISIVHIGRLCSYTLIGIIGGATSHWLRHGTTASVMNALYILVNLLMLWYGYRLIRGQTLATNAFLQRWEKFIAIRLTRRTQAITLHQAARSSYASSHTPPSRWFAAWSRGVWWGFLPCGLTYSAAALTVASGTWYQGGAVMLLFGVATLPTFAVLGGVWRWLRQSKYAAIIQGILLIAAGTFGLARALFMQHAH